MKHWHGWKREEITEDAVKQRAKELNLSDCKSGCERKDKGCRPERSSK